MNGIGKQIRLEEVRPDGAVELGRLQALEVIVGREPGEGGITVPNNAISRQHGVFFRVRNHWFYKDLGSTNGSWINGRQLEKDKPNLVRPGDSVQLSDTVLRLSAVEGIGSSGPAGAAGGRSLIVFSRGEFLDEYPVPEYGRALVLGGSQCDLEIQGVLNEVPSLVIERKGVVMNAYTVAKGVAVTVNGKELKEKADIKDGDEVVVANYSILVNDPTPRGVTSTITDTASEAVYTSGVYKDWGGGAPPAGVSEIQGKARSKSLFGRPMDEQSQDLDETLAVDPKQIEAQLSRRDVHPSMRFNPEEESEGFSFAALEDRFIILIGFGLLAALLVLLVYWVFV